MWHYSLEVNWQETDISSIFEFACTPWEEGITRQLARGEGPRALSSERIVTNKVDPCLASRTYPSSYLRSKYLN